MKITKKELQKLQKIIDNIRPEKIYIKKEVNEPICVVGRNETLGLYFKHQININNIVSFKTFALNAILFNNIIKRSTSEEIEFKLNDDGVSFCIKAGKCEYNLNIIKETYPEIENEDTKTNKIIKIENKEALLEGIKNTQFACNKGIKSYSGVLSGVRLEINNDKTTFIGLDNPRMSIFCNNNLRQNEPFFITLDANNFQCALNIMDNEISIDTSNNNIIIIYDKDTQCRISVINGDYPNYIRIIPSMFGGTNTYATNQISIEFDKKELVNALELMSIVADDHKAIELMWNKQNNDKECLLKSDSEAARGKQVVEVISYKTNDTDNFVIHFNLSYLLDALRIINDKNVTLHFFGDTKPFFIQAKNILECIVPMRV